MKKVLSMNDILIEFPSDGEEKVKKSLEQMENNYQVLRSYEYKNSPYVVVEVPDEPKKKGDKNV